MPAEGEAAQQGARSPDRRWAPQSRRAGSRARGQGCTAPKCPSSKPSCLGMAPPSYPETWESPWPPPCPSRPTALWPASPQPVPWARVPARSTVLSAGCPNTRSSTHVGRQALRAPLPSPAVLTRTAGSQGSFLLRSLGRAALPVALLLQTLPDPLAGLRHQPSPGRFGFHVSNVSRLCLHLQGLGPGHNCSSPAGRQH